MDYWEERALQILSDDLKDTSQYEQSVKKRLSTVESQIYRLIEEFVDDYASNNGMTLAEAQQQVKPGDGWQDTLEEWRKMAESAKYPQLFKEHMDIEYAKSQVSRMQAIQSQISLIMAKFADQETGRFQTSLEDAYQDNYYQSTYLAQDGKGTYQANFNMVDQQALKTVVNQNWQGSNFSERLWGNLVDKLPNYLEKSMLKGVTLGQDSKQMVREARQVFKNVEDYQLHRLILTERRNIAETATENAYKGQDVEKYRYLATLESRTCHICGSLDHEIFKVSDIRKGRNYPLIHPHCRCTTTPYFDGMDELTSGKRWSKNPITGEKELVDRMNYSEWKNWVNIASQGEEAKAAYSRWKKIANDKTADSGQRDTAKKLLSGEWTSKINNEKQAPHMESTHQKDKSYFADDVDVQRLFDKYSGTGERDITVNLDFKNTETIRGLSLPGVNYVNGEPVNVITGIKIHYSKARLHVVPYNGE